MKLFRNAIPLLVACCIALPAAVAQSANQATQTPPIKLGTSGGNIEDHSNAFCCSGTLGSVVSKGGTNYILSNNHVLARTGQAADGEDISQPGLIDSGCRPGQIVADYDQAASSGAPLGSNVDAALARVRSGQVSSTGEIIGIGVPSSIIASPTLADVAKSGRTTGLTCGTIGSVNTSVSVQYQQGCNSGKKFVISYSNQVVVNSSSFSAGGDSGSLIVTAAEARPIALLFAGSSTTTIGNPVNEVANKLGVNFVGGGDHPVSCSGGGGGGNGGGHGHGGNPHGASAGQEISQAAIERATYIKEQHVGELMNTLGVQGVGIGATEQGEAAIIVYLIQGQAHGRIPTQIEGVPTRVINTDRFRAYGWNEQLEPAVSCQK